MRFAFAILIAFGCVATVRSDESEPKAETLGFDVKKVEPPDGKKGEPIARLFYEYIYPADLYTVSGKLTDNEGRHLFDMVLVTLRHKYIEQFKITATTEEVEQLVAALIAGNLGLGLAVWIGAAMASIAGVIGAVVLMVFSWTRQAENGNGFQKKPVKAIE